MSILTVRDIQGLSAYQNKVRIPSGHQLSFDGNLKIPVWTTGTRPVSPEIGLIGFNSNNGVLEFYTGTGWSSAGNPPSQFIVELWGAGGGGGTPGGWSFGADGGGGGYSYGEIRGLTIGTNIILQVGEGGLINGTRLSFGGGGQATRTGSDNRYGSNGGGYTGIFLGSVTQANALMIAGGGGGGGSSRAGTGNVGGAGGGSIGQDGVSPYDGKTNFRGYGGTQVAGGQNSADGSSYTARALEGGTAAINGYGGAGGGGYFGGSAGGYSEPNTMGGGGGGSGYLNPTYIFNGQNTQGTLRSPAGQGSTGYPGGTTSFGGTPSVAGGNGYARITNVKTNQVTNYTFTGSNVTITVT